MKIAFGVINDIMVYYDKSEDTLHYKHVSVKVIDLFNALNSSRDRVILQSELILQKTNLGIKLGCLDIKHPQIKSLLNNLKNERNSK